MAIEIVYRPKVTLIAKPQFIEPNHMKTNWIGEASDGERLTEFGGRVCYMSQHNPAGRSTTEYIENIKKQGHGSVLEHATYSLLLEGISRSCTHELVRHRAGFAYSQLSQRYVDESDTAFVMPPAIMECSQWVQDDWIDQMREVKENYADLVESLMKRFNYIEDKTHRRKVAREAARSVLPNATETKILVTGNARAWRTMLELRCGLGAEKEIRRLALEILNVLSREAPAFFNDFKQCGSFDPNIKDFIEEVASVPLYHKV